MDWGSIKSIEQVQDMYTEFLNSSYQNSVHSSINMTPRERFMKDYNNILRKTNDEIDECFLHKTTRLVKSDGTISLNNLLYEVPQQFIKKYINIKYNPEDLSQLYIYNEKNQRLHTVKYVDKISNSKYKRQEMVNLYRKDSDINV